MSQISTTPEETSRTIINDLSFLANLKGSTFATFVMLQLSTGIGFGVDPGILELISLRVGTHLVQAGNGS